MAKLLQLRRGTTSQHSSFTGAVGEVTVDTDKDVVVVHDGSTAGGTALATEASVTAKQAADAELTELATMTSGTAGALADLTQTEVEILDGATVTTAELNILDGVTSTAAELNLLDGVTSTTAELNILDGVTSTTAELNLLDGVTSTTAELNILDGVTSTAAELNLLDGVTATTAELNYTDGVTSNIQTQLNAKGTGNGDAVLANDQNWTGAQRGAVTALTDGATIAVDFNSSNNYSVTLAGNRTLGQPTNQVVGQSGSIFITQDGTGSRTLAYHADWKWAGGSANAPTLSTAAGSVDRIDYICLAVNKIHAVATLAVA